MLSITKKKDELTEIELSLIPKVRVNFVPGNAGARMTLNVGDLNVYEDIPRHQVFTLFDYRMSWADIVAGGEFERELPLRIFVGKSDNFKGRYYRYEILLPGKHAISKMLPERIREYLKNNEGNPPGYPNIIDHVHLVNGEWL